jgi:hypothetical protein
VERDIHIDFKGLIFVPIWVVCDEMTKIQGNNAEKMTKIQINNESKMAKIQGNG